MKNLFNNYIFWLLLAIIGFVGVVVGFISSEIFNTIGAVIGLISALYFAYKTKNKNKNKKLKAENVGDVVDDSERGKHIRASRKEALKILESGDFQGAFSCMCTELMKHPETKEHEFIVLGMAQLIDGSLDSVDKMRCCLGLFK